jgi:hypothetical protein
MIIVLFAKKEMEVGIMIAHQQLCMVDMEMENQYNRGSEDNLEVGNTIVRLNGSNNGSLV